MSKLITTIKKKKSFIKKYLIFMLVVVSFSMIPDFIKQDVPFFTLNDNMMRLITIFITLVILLLWLLLGLTYPHLIGLIDKKKDKI